MNIAILQHSGAGGSGVVATEVGLLFARAGDTVHFVADRLPFRLTELGVPNVFYHQVDTMSYPLFDSPLTTLSEASKLAEVIEEYTVDVIHAHYAVPHATAAILAREMVTDCGKPAPAVVTTLHGTDVTLVGLDRAYLRTTQHAIRRSDVVTAVSHYLAAYTRDEMGISTPIRVIHNAVDLSRFSPGDAPELRRRYAHPDEKLLIHVSNFRPVKRVQDVVRVFARVSEVLGARLLMVGDGPDRHAAMDLAAELGVSGRVAFLGSFPRVEDLLRVCDLFLLPSAQESFGLAALEAMAAGVPVVASDRGGIPEVVEDGVSGSLHPLGDVAGMAESALHILSLEQHPRFRAAARQRAETAFGETQVLPLYRAAYEDAISRRRSSSGK